MTDKQSGGADAAGEAAKAEKAEQAPPVLGEVRDGVGIVTLNRPASLNAWSSAMATHYFDTLERMAEDPDVVVILVHGAGRGFCAGADMKVLKNIADSGGATPGRETRPYWHALTIGKPVVAAIHGPCYTVGLAQALCCDLRFAARDARISAPYARMGLNAEVGIGWLLSRIVGVAGTMEFFLSGREFSGDEAKELGLVNRVFDADALFDSAFEYCANVAASSSPWSLRTIKQQVYADLMTLSLQPAFERSETLMQEALASDDFAEGVAAFRDKRKPAFAPLASALTRIDLGPGNELHDE
jgi:enoyl-CoA hydratase/carnithine racemase